MASYHNPVDDPEQEKECIYCQMMIRVKRAPYHYMKCAKNHPEKNIKVCPLNAAHLVHGSEYRHHVDNCPDKALIERPMLYEAARVSGIGGDCSNPRYDEAPQMEESWDDDADAPAFGVPDKYMPPPPAPQRNSSMTSDLRPPRAKPHVLSEQQHIRPALPGDDPNAQALQALARGRGLGRGSVGAPQAQQPQVGNRSTGGGSSIGRGRAVTTDSAHQTAAQQAPRVPKTLPQSLQQQQQPRMPNMALGRGRGARFVTDNSFSLTSSGGSNASTPTTSASNSPGRRQDTTDSSNGETSNPPNYTVHNNTHNYNNCTMTINNNCNMTFNNTEQQQQKPAGPQYSHGGQSRTGTVNNDEVLASGGAFFITPKVPIQETGYTGSVEANGQPLQGTHSSSGESDKENLKERRKVNKKLRAIMAIEQRMKKGETLTSEEVEKFSKKQDLEAQLAALSL